MSRGRSGRIRTAREPNKAFHQYEQLKREGRVRRALVIVEKMDGGFSMLGQMTDPEGCAMLLMVGAEALAQAAPTRAPEQPRGAPVAPPSYADQRLHPGIVSPWSEELSTPSMGKGVHSVAASWAAFEQAVLGSEFGDIQRTEMRRAFYAGARELLNTMLAVLDPGTEPTEADLRMMDGLNAELEGFLEDMKAGRA